MPPIFITQAKREKIPSPTSLSPIEPRSSTFKSCYDYEYRALVLLILQRAYKEPNELDSLLHAAGYTENKQREIYNLLIECETIANELPCDEVHERWRDKIQLQIHICYCPAKSNGFQKLHNKGAHAMGKIKPQLVYLCSR